MLSLQHLLRASYAILFLVFCLQLGLNNAQTNIPTIIGMNVTMPRTAFADEEIELTLRVNTELKECMVIKTYLVSNASQDGPFNYKYTACLCNDNPRTFFWDFQANKTMTITTVVDIVRDKGICPNDIAVIPITANRFFISRNLMVY